MSSRLILLCSVSSAGVGLTAEHADLQVVEKKNIAVGFCTSAGSRVAGVPVGQTLHEMVFSRAGQLACVADNRVLWMDYDGSGGNPLSIVDRKLRRRPGMLPRGQFHRPHGIAADPRSSPAFVTSENPDRFVLVDLDTRAAIRDFDNGGVDPHMVTFGKGGVWGHVSNGVSGNLGPVRAVPGELHLIEVGRPPRAACSRRTVRSCRSHVATRVASTSSIPPARLEPVRSRLEPGPTASPRPRTRGC